MKAYGIDGDLLKWFDSYLESRKQRVVIKESSSSLRNISAGVPQGSVLGPLLFLIYINDISERLISLCRLFADDTSFSYSSHDGLHIQNVIDHDLKELDEWSQKWLMSFNPNKTEIMLFSNVETPHLLFSLHGKNIPVSNSHKHLGVTFTDDAKWNQHVDNIVKSISKHLNVLRKLKFKLSRTNLEKLYLIYIRPFFEYASEVWDICGVGNCNKLEQLQLEAGRIVTGLPVFTNSRKVYEELGWETLQERRKRKKLQMFYNIQYNNTPNYLSSLIPPSLQSTTIYPLRHGEDIIIPFCRLALTSESFIPSTIRQWNSLDISIRKAESLSKFKNAIKTKPGESPPKYYAYGPRSLNVLLTQLRCSASFLNYDLFKVNILSEPSCRCGNNREDSYHFFFECRLYTDLRITLLNKLNWLPDDCNLDLNLLTCGSNLISNEQNEYVFRCVYEYIKKTERFLLA